MTALLRRERRGGGGPLVSVTPTDAGWQYISFEAWHLPAGERLTGETGGRETGLIVLGGRATLAAGGHTWPSVGERADVWERKPPAVLLLPPGTAWSVAAETDLHLAVAGAPVEPPGSPPVAGGGRVAEAPVGGRVAEAPAANPAPVGPRLIGPGEIAVEERGVGQTYRYIQHLLPPSAQAARLILVEVYTPAGNWSSFPPHKHDTEDPPRESYLEEVYYHQVKPATGFSIQRVYTADRSLDETMAPGNGDLVLVPRGYHPVAATPGHDSYYLNVMAGPTRAWNFQPDPDYAHLMNWQKPAVAK